MSSWVKKKTGPTANVTALHVLYTLKPNSYTQQLAEAGHQEVLKQNEEMRWMREI